MKKDFYDIIGVDRNLQGEEFDKQLKEKYKKLALKYHPDRWAKESEEKKNEAAEKFKEISEAYATLSDEKKRQEYDMRGMSGGFGFNPWGEDFDPTDFFGERRQQVPKGRDAAVRVSITLKESFNGVTKDVAYDVMKKCSHCNGTGDESGKATKCPTCNGTGRYRRSSFAHGMTIINETICPECGGRGIKIGKKCSHCGGSGFESEKKYTKINIPAGVVNGNELIVKGLGSESTEPNGVNGDLHVIITVTDDGTYGRDGNNIIINLNVDIADALLGCKKRVETIDGSKFDVTIPELTKDNTPFRISGHGFTAHDFFGRPVVGDTYVVVKYNYPKTMSNKLREILKELKKNG